MLKTILKRIGLFVPIASIAYPIWFGYVYVPFKKDGRPGKGTRSDPKRGCVSPDRVAFVLAFEHLGAKGAKIEPGKANQYLADWLEAHASCFSLVLTQKAVSDALENECCLKDGTPVVQMHRHDPGIPVRTLEALRCALDRFEDPPTSVVLVAHDKQYERAFNDLESICPHLEIINPRMVNVPYKDGSFLNPFLWALRELYIARPVDYFRRRWGTVRCPDGVRLGKIDPSGKSQSRPTDVSAMD